MYNDNYSDDESNEETNEENLTKKNLEKLKKNQDENIIPGIVEKKVSFEQNVFQVFKHKIRNVDMEIQITRKTFETKEKSIANIDKERKQFIDNLNAKKIRLILERDKISIALNSLEKSKTMLIAMLDKITGIVRK